MASFPSSERIFFRPWPSSATAIHFLPERIAFEKAALGREFRAGGPGVERLGQRSGRDAPQRDRDLRETAALIEALHARLAAAPDVTRRRTGGL